jgi:hypothetical protein
MSNSATKRLSTMSLNKGSITHGKVASSVEWRKELEGHSSSLPDGYVFSKTLVFKPSKFSGFPIIFLTNFRDPKGPGSRFGHGSCS